MERLAELPASFSLLTQVILVLLGPVISVCVETKLLFDIRLFSRRGTDPAAAFFHRLTEKHGYGEVVFLGDGSVLLNASLYQ